MLVNVKKIVLFLDKCTGGKKSSVTHFLFVLLFSYCNIKKNVNAKYVKIGNVMPLWHCMFTQNI